MKQHGLRITGILFTSLTLLTTSAWADDDRSDDRSDDRGRGGYYSAQQSASPIVSALYKQECASCHFAYPASFLPRQSWTKIMSSLSDHFGDNAELEVKKRGELTAFLTKYATERYVPNISKFTHEKDIPIRITNTSYFKREHREIPERMVSGNPQVKSFSNCQSCHTGADRGSFSESGVRIPNYGGWD